MSDHFDPKAAIDLSKLMELVRWANTAFPIVAPLIQQLIEILRAEPLPPLTQGAAGHRCPAELSDCCAEAVKAQIRALAAVVKAHQMTRC